MNRKERREVRKLRKKEAQALVDYRKRGEKLDQEIADLKREVMKK